MQLRNYDAHPEQVGINTYVASGMMGFPPPVASIGGALLYGGLAYWAFNKKKAAKKAGLMAAGAGAALSYLVK